MNILQSEFVHHHGIVEIAIGLLHLRFCLSPEEAHGPVSQQALRVPAAWRCAHNQLLAEQDESSCFNCNQQSNLIFEVMYFALEALTRDCDGPLSSLIKSVYIFFSLQQSLEEGNVLLFVFSSDSALMVYLQPSSKTIYYYFSFFFVSLQP